MLRLYDNLISGNGYKVRLLLTQLGLPFERVEMDIFKGETRTPAFLALNPNGRIPTLRLENGSYLAESNAILCYLAEDTDFWPADRKARAETLQWLFFEQYSHEPYIAVLRFWAHLPELTAQQEAERPGRKARGDEALGVMERHLAERSYFVGERYGIADIALYAYTHVAEEGGFELAPYPAVRAWLARVAAQPNHVPITAEVGEVPATTTRIPA
jgi:glutathione S-transferase